MTLASLVALDVLRNRMHCAARNMEWITSIIALFAAASFVVSLLALVQARKAEKVATSIKAQVKNLLTSNSSVVSMLGGARGQGGSGVSGGGGGSALGAGGRDGGAIPPT